MMKAQLREAGEQVVLQVCGRVTEGWVTELERCWRSARTEHPRSRFSVDLRGVTFIDRAGEDLLKQMHQDGVSFLASGLLIQEVVNQVTGGSK